MLVKKKLSSWPPTLSTWPRQHSMCTWCAHDVLFKSQQHFSFTLHGVTLLMQRAQFWEVAHEKLFMSSKGRPCTLGRTEHGLHTHAHVHCWQALTWAQVSRGAGQPPSTVASPRYTCTKQSFQVEHQPHCQHSNRRDSGYPPSTLQQVLDNLQLGCNPQDNQVHPSNHWWWPWTATCGVCMATLMSRCLKREDDDCVGEPERKPLK